MHRPSIVRPSLAVLTVLSLAAPGLAQVPPEALDATEPAPEIKLDAGDELRFDPPADLSDALERALAAVRKAEDRQADMNDKLKEALFYRQAAYKFDPGNKKAEFISGRMNILAGRARDAFTQIHEYAKSPQGQNDWEAYRILGDLYYNGGYYVQAKAKYERAIVLNANDAKSQIGLALCAIKRGRRGEALRASIRATELDPASPEAFDCHARALMAAELADDALRAIRQAIDRTQTKLRDKPGDTHLLNQLVARYGIHQRVLNLIIQRDLAAPDPYQEFARGILEQADVQRTLAMTQATKTLEQAIEATAPNTPAAIHIDYADVLARVGRFDDAIEVLNHVLDTEPANQAATDKLAEVRRQQAQSDRDASTATAP